MGLSLLSYQGKGLVRFVGMARRVGERRPETMRTIKDSVKFAAVFFAIGLFTGCGSTGGGSSSSSVGVYYGVGFYDPWYYGGYDDDAEAPCLDWE
jgi:hypothetical protein